jgi:glycosyltransferase involved in cell wall biosynthesis
MTAPYSVVIPAWNAEATIGAAIASVLAQTAPPAAICVVDDGSADGTAAAALAAGGPVTVVRKENGGPGSATTAGLARVATPYVATLDADDLWLPRKMERQLAALASDPGLAASFALGRHFRDGEEPDPDGPGAVQRLWTRTTMVYRIDAAREIGEMRDFPGYLGDLVDWLARGRDLGHRHGLLEEVLAMRRVRAGSLSHRADERAKGYLHAVRDALRRRRTDPGRQA